MWLTCQQISWNEFNTCTESSTLTQSLRPNVITNKEYLRMPAGHNEQDQASTITHSFYMKFVYINRYAVIVCLKSSICLHERGRQRPLFFSSWPRWCKMRHFFWISWFRSVLVSFIIVPPVSADVQPICRASGEPRPRQSCRSDGSDWQSFYTQTHTHTDFDCVPASQLCLCLQRMKESEDREQAKS